MHFAISFDVDIDAFDISTDITLPPPAGLDWVFSRSPHPRLLLVRVPM